MIARIKTILGLENHPNVDILYIPQNDITAFEVSKCLEIMIGLFNWHNLMGYEEAKKFVLSYPKQITRHFKFKE